MIDNIEKQVETAAIHVEDGKGNLYKAAKYKIQSRKMKLIIAAIIGVILLILLLVILSEFGAFEGDNTVYVYVTPTPPPTTTTTTTATTTTSTTLSTTPASSSPPTTPIMDWGEENP